MPKRKRDLPSPSSDSKSESPLESKSESESEGESEASSGTSASAGSHRPSSASEPDLESEPSDWEAKTKSKSKKGTGKNGLTSDKNKSPPKRKRTAEKTSTTNHLHVRTPRACLRKLSCEVRKFQDDEVTKSFLEMDGYVFEKCKEVETTHTCTWKCQAVKRYKCRVRFVTVGNELTQYTFKDNKPLEHNHPPCTAEHKKTTKRPKRKRYQQSSNSESESPQKFNSKFEDKGEAIPASAAGLHRASSKSESDPESEPSDWNAETKTKGKKKRPPKKKIINHLRAHLRKLAGKVRKFPDEEVKKGFLAMDDYIFKKCKEVETTRTWECQAATRYKCRVRLMTVDDELTHCAVKDDKQVEHSHPPPTAAERELIIKRSQSALNRLGTSTKDASSRKLANTPKRNRYHTSSAPKFESPQESNSDLEGVDKDSYRPSSASESEPESEPSDWETKTKQKKRGRPRKVKSTTEKPTTTNNVAQLLKVTGEVRKLQDDEVTKKFLMIDGYVFKRAIKSKDVETTRTWDCQATLRCRCRVKIMTVGNELTHRRFKDGDPVEHSHPPPSTEQKKCIFEGKAFIAKRLTQSTYRPPKREQKMLMLTGESSLIEKWPQYKEFISQCLKRSKVDILTPLLQIYESESYQFLNKNTDQEMRENMPRFDEVRAAMTSKRQAAKAIIRGKRRSPTDYQIHVLAMKEEDSTTYTGEPFLIADESFSRKRLLVFASKEGLQVLAKSAIIYMDGTYDISTLLFEQIYTIHVMPQNGILLPVVYAVLPDRTLESYLKFLESLVASCGNLGLQLCPVRVQTGFEDEMLTAIQQIWPLSELSCSHYFYTHSIARKLQEVGLQKMYAQTGNTGRTGLHNMCHRFIALPLVPPDEVDILADYILLKFAMDNNSLNAGFRTKIMLTEFKEWFRITWLDKHPVALWNHYERMGPRMNAYLEKWHKKVKDVLRKSKRNIYELIALFRMDESIYCWRVEQAATDQYPRGRFQPYVVASKLLQEFRSDLENGQITSKRYLKRVAELPEMKAVFIHFKRKPNIVDPTN